MNNTSFDEDLTLAVVKRNLVYNSKKTFSVAMAELEWSSFYVYKVKNYCSRVPDEVAHGIYEWFSSQ